MLPKDNRVVIWIAILLVLGCVGGMACVFLLLDRLEGEVVTAAAAVGDPPQPSPDLRTPPIQEKKK